MRILRVCLCLLLSLVLPWAHASLVSDVLCIGQGHHTPTSIVAHQHADPHAGHDMHPGQPGGSAESAPDASVNLHQASSSTPDHNDCPSCDMCHISGATMLPASTSPALLSSSVPTLRWHASALPHPFLPPPQRPPHAAFA